LFRYSAVESYAVGHYDQSQPPGRAFCGFAESRLSFVVLCEIHMNLSKEVGCFGLTESPMRGGCQRQSTLGVVARTSKMSREEELNHGTHFV
jgi:hypothetical protein